MKLRKNKINRENISDHKYFYFGNMTLRQLISQTVVTLSLLASTLILVVMSLSAGRNNSQKMFDNSTNFDNFTEGWYLEDNTEISIRKYVLPEDKKNEGITIHKEIPSNCKDEFSIGFEVRNLFYRAYIDLNDNGVEDDGEYLDDPQYFYGINEKFNKIHLNNIMLNESFAGHDLYIEVQSDSFVHSIILGATYGSESSVINSYYGRIDFQFYLGLALAFLSIMLFLFSFFNKTTRDIAPQLAIISLFGLAFSIYAVFSSGYFQILTGNLFIFDNLTGLMFSISIWLLSFYLYLKSSNMVMLVLSRICTWTMVTVIGLYVPMFFFPRFELPFLESISAVILVIVSVLSLINSLLKLDKKENIVFVAQEVLFVLCLIGSLVTQITLDYFASVVILEMSSVVLTTCALSFEFQVNVIKAKDDLKDREEEQQTRMAIMLAQIQPHFLYNSLNSIAVLCDMNPKLARDLTIKFSQYLRNNIDSLNKDAPVFFTNELKNINNYLDIEKIRFSNKLNIVENIEITDFYVPVLTIQPLVENAVKHGISKKPTSGVLNISTSQDKDNIYVTIEDDGVGFDTSILDSKEKLGKSIGFSNVKYRLESMVGGTVSIESEVGVGTKVVVTLPKMYNNSRGKNN